MYNIDDRSDDGGGHYLNQLTNTNNDPVRVEEEFVQDISKQARRTSGTLVIIVAFSLLVAVDAVVKDSNGEDINNDLGAALAIAMLSMIITVLKYCHSLFIDTQFSASFEIGFGMLMVVIWTAGVVHLTFQDTGAFFNLTSTGFFATWVCLLMSGFYTFNIWGGIQKSAEMAGRKKGCLHFKKGITPILAVTIMLNIGLISAAALTLDDDSALRIRAVMSLVFSIPTLLALLSIVCCPLSSYGDPDNFLIMLTLLMAGVFFQVFFTTMSEPFAERPDQSEPFEVVGNGFFAVMGLLGSLSVLLYNSHVFILKYDPEAAATGLQGRYIFLGLLGMSAAVMVVASAVECGAAGGCNENALLAPLIGASFFTAATVPLVYFITRENKDPGDILIQAPDEELAYCSNTYELFETCMAGLYFIIWSGGAAVFTFSVSSPFVQNSTGFFFSWFCFFFAVFYYNSVYPKIGLVNLTCMDWSPPNKMKPKANFGFSVVLLGLLVQVVAVSSECIETLGCDLESYIAFGLQAVIFTIVMILLMTTPDSLGLMAVVLNYLMCILSYVMLIATTIIPGPFDEVQGNGFFAAWVIVFGAFYVVNHYEWRFADL